MEDIKKLNEVLSKYQAIYTINGGISPIFFLGIILILLKLVEYISISWFWILAPFWIPIIFSLFITTVFIALIIIRAKDINVTVEEEKEEKKDSNIESISTEKASIDDTIKSTSSYVKSRKKSKKKKEEITNVESKESNDTRTEASINS